MNFWRDNPVLRGVVYALGTVALFVMLFRGHHPSAPAAAPVAHAPTSLPDSSSPIAKPASAPHLNSADIMARCQPELKETPSAPSFEVGERYNRAGVQLKVRFLVDHYGFVANPYVSSGTVVSPEDQEAALEFVRHLSFQPPGAEECQPLKVQMVGNFHQSKDATGDWITTFDAHPVYSLNGDRVVVNPN